MNNRIKILNIAQCAGGVDCYLRMLLKHIDKNLFEQILICSHDFHEDDYKGIVDKFIQIDMVNSLSLSGDCKAIRSIRQLIAELKPDLIYCHSSKAGGLGRLANIGLGYPILYNPHGWAFNMRGSKVKKLIYLVIERILAHFTTKFVLISNYEKLSAVEHRVGKESHMKVIFNGIDMDNIKKQLEKRSVSRKSLGIPEDAYVVGMVGRISTQKAPDTFVRMAHHIANKLPNAWFMIVGDGDDRKEIEEQIASCGLSDRFRITGWVNNPIAYASLFDQTVLLSRWEGFGLVLAECMKLGKPIVATEVNAIPDLIVDYENGILVNVDDDEQAATAVIEIHDNQVLKKKLINNSHMRVNVLFDITRVANEHERLFVNMTPNKAKAIPIKNERTV